MENRTLNQNFENWFINLCWSLRYFYFTRGYLVDTKTLQAVFYSSLADGKFLFRTYFVTCLLVDNHMRCNYFCVKS